MNISSLSSFFFYKLQNFCFNSVTSNLVHRYMDILCKCMHTSSDFFLQVLTSGFTRSRILHHIYLHRSPGNSFPSPLCPGLRPGSAPPCWRPPGHSRLSPRRSTATQLSGCPPDYGRRILSSFGTTPKAPPPAAPLQRPVQGHTTRGQEPGGGRWWQA